MEFDFHFQPRSQRIGIPYQIIKIGFQPLQYRVINLYIKYIITYISNYNIAWWRDTFHSFLVPIPAICVPAHKLLGCEQNHDSVR